MIVVDTNVLVHASAPTSPDHTTARLSLSHWAQTDTIAITRQILREFLGVTTRPQLWAKAATITDAMTAAQTFVTHFEMLEDGPAVWDQLAALTRWCQFGGKQVHDANIVATMLAHGQTRLLTFNVADFRRFNSVIEVLSP